MIKLIQLSLLFPEVKSLDVTCSDEQIPTLEGWYKKAKICCPKADKGADGTFVNKYPLTVYQHGDTGGGAALFAYDGLFNAMAAEGVCVVAPYSCPFDYFCSNGETSYLEVLKSLAYIEKNKDSLVTKYPFDLEAPYVVGGHSTGARVALMIGALIDSYESPTVPPLYLRYSNHGQGLTPELYNILPKIKAVVGDHPDPMSDPKQNPDIENYKIDKTPVFIITGTEDTLEPKGSGWLDFLEITSPTRIFVDVNKRGHLEPNNSHDEAIPIINFYKAFVYKTLSTAYFYGPKPLDN